MSWNVFEEIVLGRKNVILFLLVFKIYLVSLVEDVVLATDVGLLLPRTYCQESPSPPTPSPVKDALSVLCDVASYPGLVPNTAGTSNVRGKQ